MVNRIIKEIMVEFKVPRREVVKNCGGKDNVLRLVAFGLASDLSALSMDTAKRVFGVRSEKDEALLKNRLDKYFKYIPGFEAKYRKLRRALKKKLVDLDV